MARRRDDDEDQDEAPRSRRRSPRDEDEDEDDAPPPRRRRSRDEDEDDRPRISREDLRTVAWSQKAIILCILGNLATIPLRLVLANLPAELQVVGVIGLVVYYLAVGITATVFVFMMALKVYSTGVGVLLGLLTLIPCIGLIVLLVINSKATGVLQRNGVRVGFLGANMSDLP